MLRVSDFYDPELIPASSVYPEYKSEEWEGLDVSKKVGTLAYKSSYSTYQDTLLTDAVWFHLHDEQTWYRALELAEGMGYPAAVAGTDTDSYTLQHYTGWQHRGWYISFIPGQPKVEAFLHMEGRGLQINSALTNMIAGQVYKIVYYFDKFDVSGGLPGTADGTLVDDYTFVSPVSGNYTLHYDAPAPILNQRFNLTNVTIQKSSGTAQKLWPEGGNYKINP
jgi:hypothetical protein